VSTHPRGADATSCATGGEGTLHLAMDLPDEPWNIAPSVEIRDAEGGWVSSLAASGEIALPSGLYTLAARRGTVDGTTVGTAYGLLDDTVQRVCVADGATTEWSGTWEHQPSSGKLWALSREAACAFEPGELSAGGDVTSALSLQVPRSNDLRGMAVDALGNPWLATAPT
jgi:hypothetical protein